MMEHTKEPWKYGKELSARSGERLISLDAGERGRGTPIAETRPATGKEQAIARRIVACVNACEGIDTDTLEHTKMVDALNNACEYTTKQRDKLLAALKEAAKIVEDVTDHGDFLTVRMEWSDLIHEVESAK